VKRLAILAILLCCVAGAVRGLERFPPPDFESGYKLPLTTTPVPRSDLMEGIDLAVLVLALAAASYFALKRRSRRALFIVMLGSLVYFGFYRKGCVCAIGAIQNVTLALFDSGYAIPLTVVGFFVAPLAATLLFGRTFCASVCPLGAIQDVVIVKPVKVPAWLEHGLGLLAYIYLGLAVLFAATGSAFLLCEYDPFVAFFRRTGTLPMLALGVGFLVLGVFVGRPYCRFFCPYGALVRVLSRISWLHARITPAECIQCRLCEETCPFGAIRKPALGLAEPERAEGRKRLAALVVLVPVLVAMGGLLGARLSPVMARMHATVRLADRMQLEESGEVTDTAEAADAFRATGRPVQELYDEAAAIGRRFGRGGWAFGGWVGLVVGVKLVHLSIRRRRTDWEPDRAACVSCGRCFKYCPVELKPRPPV